MRKRTTRDGEPDRATRPYRPSSPAARRRVAERPGRERHDESVASPSARAPSPPGSGPIRPDKKRRPDARRHQAGHAIRDGANILRRVLRSVPLEPCARPAASGVSPPRAGTGERDQATEIRRNRRKQRPVARRRHPGGDAAAIPQAAAPRIAAISSTARCAWSIETKLSASPPASALAMTIRPKG